MGAGNVRSPSEPGNGADPNANTPPSDATNQYPPPSGAAATPTTGRFNTRSPNDPKNRAPSTERTPPSAVATHDPPSVRRRGRTPGGSVAARGGVAAGASTSCTNGADTAGFSRRSPL